MMLSRSFSAVALLALVSCGGGADNRILQGEREDVLPSVDAVVPDRIPALNLPAARTNANWTHRRGSAEHRIAHPALGQSLTHAFSVPIGQGESRRTLITADPVVSDGRVFTIDAQATLVATSTNGTRLWSASLVPPDETPGQGATSGIAVEGNTVFATSGYGELTALDVVTGETIWLQDLEAAGGSSPTVKDGLVYIAARDSRAWALDAETGRIRWTATGTPELQGYAGGAGVAVTDEFAVFPFKGGEVLATFPQGGLRRWGSNVVGRRVGYASSTISDISGDPVIDDDTVYIANISGRAVALDLYSGERKWTANMAAKSPMTPAGGSVFLVNDLNQLVRLDAATGATLWTAQLSQFAQNRVKRRNRFFAHYGPVLAGGRLVVASSDGSLSSFNPNTGALLSTVDLPAPAASSPAVSGGVLYVVTTNGVLTAYR